MCIPITYYDSRKSTTTKMTSGEISITEIIRCSTFAAIKHKNQRRKDPENTPYINHPIGDASD